MWQIMNSPEQYKEFESKTGVGNPLQCRWRAEEVGQWMEFLDMDEDGNQTVEPTVM